MLARGMKVSMGIASGENIARVRRLAISGLIAGLLACSESTAPAPETAPVPLPSDIVAQYELQSIGGVAITNGVWGVIGGHYVLYANGTYAHYYDYGVARPRTLTPIGNYIRSANGVIDFYLSEPYPDFYFERSGHFARGQVSGDAMRTTYDDLDDFKPEVYVAK